MNRGASRSISLMAPNLQRCFWTLTCALLLCATQASHAAAIVGSMQENFDYPDATQFGTPNGGLGFNATGDTSPNAAGANWGGIQTAGNATLRTATAPGLTYSATGYLPASGNKLTLDAATSNQTQNVGRTLGGQTIDTGTTFFSLLMSKNNDTIRTMNWAFFNGTSERFAVGQIGAAAGNTAGNIGMLMNNSNPAGLIQNTTTPIAMGVGVTHLLVGRIDWNPSGFETVSLWVDPTDVTTEAAAGSIYVSTSGFELQAITGVRPFAGNNVTGPPAIGAISANFDEFRIGGTWESVTSLPVSVAAPEPTTAVMAALGFGFLILRRRQSR